MPSYILFEDVDERIAIEKQSGAFKCPCCKTTLQFLVRTSVSGVRAISDEEGNPMTLKIDESPQKFKPHEIKRAEEMGNLDEEGKMTKHVRTTLPLKVDTASKINRPKSLFSDDEQEILREAEKSGILKAFKDAIDMLQGNKPKSVEKTFLSFLKNATKRDSHPLALQRIIQQASKNKLETGKFELWGFNRLFGITLDGEFRLFLPIEFVKGASIAKFSNDKGKIKQTKIDSGEWIRTGNGYVSAGKNFSAHLKAKNYGTLAGD